MRPRTAHLLSMLLVAAAAACAALPATAAAAPSVSTTVPAQAGAKVRPRLTVVVRDAPRGARVLLQERMRDGWSVAGDDGERVRGDRRVELRWRGLRGRDAVTVRAALLDRRGRTLDTTDPRTVVRASDGPLVLAADALRRHARGTDRWDVWTCGEAGGSAADATEVLETQVAPFYAWLSGGRYEQRFRARGALADDDGPLAGDDMTACAREASERSAGREGALIVQRDRVSAVGDACLEEQLLPDPCAGAPATLPGNERIAWLGPEALLGPAPHISTVVHELGHALGWPHAFTGRLRVEHEGVEIGVEYDDPFDVMGYERLWGSGGWDDPSAGTFAPKATQAFLRIAAGWVPDAAIELHDDRRATYALGPLDRRGLQVVVVPTADARAFLTLEARVQRPFDPVPGEGVVVHAIDQRPAACDVDEAVVGCWADQLRASPAPNAPDTLDHLVTVGERLRVAGVRVAVTGRDGDRFTVEVEGERAAFAPLKPTVCLYAPEQCAGGMQPPLPD